MEKGHPESREEGLPEKAPPDEGAILRYEEHITELLVTVAHLHGQIEHLQREKGREEEEEFSDFCSEYTASLPRRPEPGHPAGPSPPPSRPEKKQPDLFLAVHQAVTSLENVVSSHRSRIPSVEAIMEGSTQVAESFEESLKKFQRSCKELFPQPGKHPVGSDLEFLTGDTSIYEQEIALYREKNTALRGELESRDEELSQYRRTLSAYQEERDKLQRKVKDLQETLSKAETLQGGAGSPLCEQDPLRSQDPVAVAAQQFLHCLQDVTSLQPTPGLSSLQAPAPGETPLRDPRGTPRDQLHRSIEMLQRLNQHLLVILQETKSDTEGISMLLGLSESDNTALHLAVQYSEGCLEAYEVLFSLAVAERDPCVQVPAKGEDPPGTGEPHDFPQQLRSAVMEKARLFLQSHHMDGETPGGPSIHSELSLLQEGDDRKVLLDYIRCLRAAQDSLRLPALRPPPGPDSVAAKITSGIEAKVAEVRRGLHDVLLSERPPSKMEKGALLRELQAAREALAELNTCLHLAEKEKQRLALQMYTYRAQEAACLLMIRVLQAERDELCGQRSVSSSGESSSGSSDSEEYGPAVGYKRKMSGLLEDPSGNGAEPEQKTLQLHEALACNRELKDRIQSLLVDLEEQSQESRAQEMQEMELTRDFFKAHSALVLAYRNARKKQEAQIHQLESQMAWMSQRHSGQLQSLRQTLQGLGDGVGGLAEVPQTSQSS